MGRSAVWAYLGTGQPGGVADAAQAAACGGVRGERGEELLGIDGVGVDAGPAGLARRRWWLPGDRFVDAVVVKQQLGLVVHEVPDRRGQGEGERVPRVGAAASAHAAVCVPAGAGAGEQDGEVVVEDTQLQRARWPPAVGGGEPEVGGRVDLAGGEQGAPAGVVDGRRGEAVG